MTERDRPQNREQEIIEGLKVVCKCRNVKKSALLKHIRSGARSLEELKKLTGAGTGTCKGKECLLKIEEILKEELHSGSSKSS